MKDKQMTKTIKGIAAPLPLANVDTDVIMPKRFLITITREGLGDGTFADLRFDSAGEQRPEFILNKSPWTRASILVVGDNLAVGLAGNMLSGACASLGLMPALGQGLPEYFTTMPAKTVWRCRLYPLRRATYFCNLPAMPAVTRYRLILKGARSQLLILAHHSRWTMLLKLR